MGNRAAERHMTLLLLTNFLIGTLMMCVEVIKWWKKRMEQYEPPPLANLISYIPDRERCLACNPSALVSSLGPSRHSWAVTSSGAEHR